MDSLRLILMLIGAVIILAVYLHNRLKKVSSQKLTIDSSALDASLQSSTHDAENASNDRGVIVDPSVYSFESKQVDHDSCLDDELSELGSHIKIDDGDPVQPQERGGRKKGKLVEKVMVIYLLAQPNQGFSGSDIKNIAGSEGLQFGADSYFHRYSNPDEKKGSIFGIANILEPGLFDSLDNEGFATPGLVFFQQLSNAGNALEAFDEMLKTIIQFKEKLDGRLQDSGRHSLNKKGMIKLREQVSEYSQKKPVSQF